MKLIIANWKSHKNREAVEKWLDDFEGKYTAQVEKQVVICPPMSSLMFVSNRLLNREKNKDVYLGVQDISPYPAGKYTGAVSTENLNGFNVRYAIVGHSERRRYFHETHNDVANKVAQCIDAGITPIVCVDDEYISSQAAAIPQEHLIKCIVAYEELSAIGSGKNEPVEHVKEVFAEIKKYFGSVKLIYGGSVDVDNVQDYLSFCDGVLVGTASLDVSDFIALL